MLPSQSSKFGLKQPKFEKRITLGKNEKLHVICLCEGGGLRSYMLAKILDAFIRKKKLTKKLAVSFGRPEFLSANKGIAITVYRGAPTDKEMYKRITGTGVTPIKEVTPVETSSNVVFVFAPGISEKLKKDAIRILGIKKQVLRPRFNRNNYMNAATLFNSIKKKYVL